MKTEVKNMRSDVATGEMADAAANGRSDDGGRRSRRVGMMKRAVVLVAGLSALAGCDEEAIAALGGATSSPEQRADYLAAVSTTDCVLIDQRQYGAVEFQANLTREEVIEITQFYLTFGGAERLEEGGVRIVTGPCAA